MRLGSLTACLCALLLLALPAGASAAPGVGINVAGIPSPAEVTKAADTGARYLRVWAFWHALEPTRGRFDDNVITRYRQIVDESHARGMTLIFVLTSPPRWASGSSDPNVPPTDPADFASFARRFAAQFPDHKIVYEIWNEEDEDHFWHPTPDAVRYTALLKASYAAIHEVDKSATVLFGPLTASNTTFLRQALKAGAAGSFDGVAVHVDNACLITPPDEYYRDPDGSVGRFSFLGFRTLHEMLSSYNATRGALEAVGIWLTEIGWSVTNRLCQSGRWAGTGKKAGVDENTQAEFLKRAFHCIGLYDYIRAGVWFSLRDGDTELNRYGLYRSDGTRRPSLDAFKDVAARRDDLAGKPCGDFDAPRVTIVSPNAAGGIYDGPLHMAARATDARSELSRLTFKMDGNALNHVSKPGNGRLVTMTYYRAKNLSFGNHTLTIEASDKYGNVGSQSIEIVHVDSSTLPARPSQISSRLRVTGHTYRYSGRVGDGSIEARAAAPPVLGLQVTGTVRIRWQRYRPRQGKRKARWITVHRNYRTASKPFAVKRRITRRGMWRVRAEYLGNPPFLQASAKWKRFRVK